MLQFFLGFWTEVPANDYPSPTTYYRHVGLFFSPVRPQQISPGQRWQRLGKAK